MYIERAVVNEIRKQQSVMPGMPKIYYWRAHSGAEVDLVLEKDGQYFPIEIKISTHPDKSSTRGLLEFRKTYAHLKIAPGIVLAPVEKVFPLNEHDCAVPWDII